MSNVDTELTDLDGVDGEEVLLKEVHYYSIAFDLRLLYWYFLKVERGE